MNIGLNNVCVLLPIFYAKKATAQTVKTETYQSILSETFCQMSV